MTDRGLLELAAKAAGIPLEFRILNGPSKREYPCYLDKDSVSVLANRDVVIIWNPITDDGDALRLAVKLGLIIHQQVKMRIVTVDWSGPQEEIDEPYGDDPYAATCRAIVRAAAEIGKEMK
jgi:hypothetical protein